MRRCSEGGLITDEEAEGEEAVDVCAKNVGDVEQGTQIQGAGEGEGCIHLT